MSNLSHLLPNANDLKKLAATHYQYIDNQRIALNRLNMHLLFKARSGVFKTTIHIRDYIPEGLITSESDVEIMEDVFQFYKCLITSSLQRNDFLVYTRNRNDLTLDISWCL